MASAGGLRVWTRALVGVVDTAAIRSVRQDAGPDQGGRDPAEPLHLLAMARLRLA